VNLKRPMNGDRQRSSTAVIVRFVIFLGVWCVVDEIKPVGLAIGLVAAGLATWVSLWLLPPSTKRLRIFPLLSLGLHFMRSSILAAVEVALYAFRRRLALRPGYITYQCGIPAGTKRDLYLSMVSLMPGSVPVDSNENGQVVMHCLDTKQPVVEQMADNEARLTRVWGNSGDA
jgi:multicomponent Na+:H+ antiporter subunit E